jgi:hypothetical protein
VDSAAVQPGGTNACTWTAGYSQGATSVTLTNCGSTGILNGDMIVLDQKDADSGRFDEHKCFLGFATEKQVINTYRRAFSDGKADKRIGHLRAMSIDQFKTWLSDGDTTKPVKHHEHTLPGG